MSDHVPYTIIETTPIYGYETLILHLELEVNEAENNFAE